MSKLIFSGAFLALLPVALSSVAIAHAQLVAAEPAADAAVKQAPTELDLKFNEELDIKFSGVKVTGPDAKEVKTENAMLMDGGKTLMVSLPASLAAGTYRVEWHALSADGHKTKGNYQFKVEP